MNGTISAGAGAVSLTSTGAISETGAITTTGLLTTNSAGGTVLNGANQVGSFNATNTTGGNVELTNTAAPLTITGIAQAGGGNVIVGNTGALAVNGTISAGAGNVNLTVTGAITQTAAISGTTLTAQTRNAAGADITLDNPGNAFANVALSSKDAAGVANTNGAISYRDADGLNLNSIQTASTAVVNANGALTQTGAVIAAGLGATATGGATLANAANDVNTFAASVTGGDLAWRDLNGFSVGTVGALNGVTASALATINAGGLVTQSQPITAGSLELLGTGGMTLNHPMNNVAVLAANATGSISYTDADVLQVLTAGGTNGINTNGGNLTINTGGTLTLAANLVATGATVAMTTTTGGITQTGGTITAAGLALSGSGAFTLEQGGNNVVTLAANTNGGALRYRDADALVIGTAGAVNGVATAGQDLILTTGGALTQNQAVVAGGLAISGPGPVTLTNAGNDIARLASNVSGAVTFTDSTGLTVDTVAGIVGIVGAPAVTLATINGPLVVNQLITANTINLTVGGATGTLEVNANLTAAASLNALANGSVNITAGNLSAPLMTLTSNLGSISQTGAGLITTPGLTLNTATGAQLNNINAISTLTATNTGAGNIVVNNRVNPMSVLAITNAGGNISVTNDGNVTVTGPVRTTGGNGSVTVAASIGSLLVNGIISANGSGDVTLTNTLGSFTLNQTVSSGTGNIRISAPGDLTIANGSIATGGSVFLTSTGGFVRETGVGTVTAAALTATAQNGIALANVNNVAAVNLTGTGAFDIAYTNANTNGVVVSARTGGSGNTVTVTEQLGNLTIGAGGVTTQGGAITLTSLGAGKALIVNGVVDTTANGNSAGAALTYRADDMALTAQSRAGTSAVSLNSVNQARIINLGSGIGGLDLSNTDLGSIVTGGSLLIGDAARTGAIRVTGNAATSAVTGLVTLTNNTGGIAVDGTFSAAGALTLTANGNGAVGAITDNGSGLLNSNGPLVLNAATGIGVISDAAQPLHLAPNRPLHIGVASLVTPTNLVSGDINIAKQGALLLGPVINLVGNASFTASGTTTADSIRATSTVRTGTLYARTLNDVGAGIFFDNLANDTVAIDLHTRNAVNTATSAGGISYYDSNAFTVLNIETNGALDLRGNANIDLGRVGSSFFVDAGTGSITINAAGNIDLRPGVTLRGSNVTLIADNNLNVSAGFAGWSNADINAGAAGGSLTLAARNDVNFVNGQIGAPGARFNHDLTLRAGNNVAVQANFYLGSSATLNLFADASIAQLSGVVPNGAGDVLLGSAARGNFVIDSLGAVNVSGVNFTVRSQDTQGARQALLTTGDLDVRVSRDVTIQAGSGSTAEVRGAKVTVAAANLTVQSGQATSASAAADATLRATGALTAVLTGDLSVRAGSATGTSTTPTTALATLQAGTTVELTTGGNLLLQGGIANSANGAAVAGAVLLATGSATIVTTGDLVLRGGTVNGTAGIALSLLSSKDLTVATGGNVVLVGGKALTGSAASAAINAEGEIKMLIGARASHKEQGIDANFAGGLVLIGGKGSGIFDSNQISLEGYSYPVTVTFAPGGIITRASDATRSDGLVQTLLARPPLTSILQAILAAVAQQDDGFGSRAKSNEDDDKDARNCR